MACHGGQRLVSCHRPCLPRARGFGGWLLEKPRRWRQQSNSSCYSAPTWQTCLAAWPGHGAHPPQPHPGQTPHSPLQLPAPAPLPAAAAPAPQPADPPAAGLPLRPLRPLLHPAAAAPAAPLVAPLAAAAAPPAAAPPPAAGGAAPLLQRQQQAVWQHQELQRYAQYQSLLLPQGPLQHCQTRQRLRCRLHQALWCPPPPLAGCRGGQARH
jgi:hypothetical protein